MVWTRNAFCLCLSVAAFFLLVYKPEGIFAIVSLALLGSAYIAEPESQILFGILLKNGTYEKLRDSQQFLEIQTSYDLYGSAYIFHWQLKILKFCKLLGLMIGVLFHSLLLYFLEDDALLLKLSSALAAVSLCFLLLSPFNLNCLCSCERVSQKQAPERAPQRQAPEKAPQRQAPKDLHGDDRQYSESEDGDAFMEATREVMSLTDKEVQQLTRGTSTKSTEKTPAQESSRPLDFRPAIILRKSSNLLERRRHLQSDPFRTSRIKL